MTSHKSLWKIDPTPTTTPLPLPRPRWSPITGYKSRLRPARTPTQDEPEETLLLESRITSALRHSRACLALGHYPTATSYFTIPASRPSHILHTLRKAAESEVATFIWGSPKEECYAVGIPPPPRYFREPDAAWFAGLTRAEMRAGPLRCAADVRGAAREVTGKARRREESERSGRGRLMRERDMLIVGVKRQFLGLPMEGEIEKRVVEGAMRAKGVTEEDLLEMVAEEEDERADGVCKKRKQKRGADGGAKRGRKKKVVLVEKPLRKTAMKTGPVAIKQPRRAQKAL